MDDITRILTAAGRGDAVAAEDLLPLVYRELRVLAARKLAGEKPGQTLDATALVHEAYLRLVRADEGRRWNGRGHFFAAAAEAMRRILIERARRVRRTRHGGGRKRLDLDELDSAQLQLDPADEASAEMLIALDAALTRLEAEDPAAAAVVKLRCFAGLGVDDAAAALGVSARTAKRHWAYAKAWLYRQLRTSRDAGV